MDNKSKLGDGETELPLYTEEQIVAYSKDPDGAYVAGSKIRFKISDLANVDITRAVCTTAPGNSMGPFIPDGAWVGVDTLNTTITDGKIYIIEHSGMLRIKTLYRTPGGGMRLTSSNREEHPDETYSNDESKNIRIIGRVFWYSVLV
ncbi:MAG: hypothetical protein MJK10_03965 [Pseudomonadales bacterium]|nr:hypothetical protein [Pseudomonadales bacterium]